jgi:YYY domain-containing protein
MSRQRARLLLALILAAGAVLRLRGFLWDEGHHLHPDERFISMVEEKVTFPGSLSAYFDSARSTLNPYNNGFGSFVYGTLPMVLAKAAGKLAGKTGYDGTYMAGRALSTLFDLLSVFLVYRIARRFAARGTALLAAALLSFCAFSIQLSHFWTVDTFLTTFTAAVLLGSVRIAQGRAGWLEDAAIGLGLGLAAACKITALALLLPVGVAILVRALPGVRAGGRSRVRWLIAAGVRLAIVVAVTAITVRVAFPTAFAGPSPFSFRLDPRWIKDLKGLANLSNSVAGFPPSLQWAGRTLWFPIRNYVLQGAGLLFGLASLASLVWALAVSWRSRRLALLPLALHTLFVFLYHGLTLVKTMRYFYPAYPAMAVLAALGTAELARRAPARGAGRLLRLTPVVVLAGTVLWALAFSAIYGRPHTRVEASRWIYDHVPPRSRMANESWDDGLPFPLPGHDNGLYSGPMLELWGPDNGEKVGQILKTLAGTDWIAVTSGRVYRNITRLPSVYPMTTAYYRALFDGRLGFDLAADFTSYPSIGPLRIPDDRAEEQFTVYDHPRVLLFRKSPSYSEDRARKLLLAALPRTPPTIWDWEKLPRGKRAVSPPVEPPASKGTSSVAPPVDAEMGSIPAAILWYLAIAAVGAAAFPLCAVIFSRLSDRGFGFARLAGLVFATYGLNLAVARGGFTNGRRAALSAVLLLAIAGAAAFFWKRGMLRAFLRENRRALWQSEAVFTAGFLFFLLIRALNPEITWGEKPMDFSILNILVRTRTLPPSDPWFAGAPLGYYTFGQQIVALLTLLTGLSTRYTFNLAFGLLGGVLLQGAFSIARTWSGTLGGGIAGAAFVGLLGNLAGLREWLAVRRPQHQPLDWHYFWATSRVIKDTINEYPLWSLLFADLHAHVLAMPLLLLFAAQALQLVRVHADRAALARTRLLAAALLGFFAAAEALTNAWDSPLLSGLLVLACLVAALGGAADGLSSAGRALLALAVAGGVAFAAASPLWPPGGGLPGWGRNLDHGASGLDVATVFGLFIFVAAAWWLAAAADRWAWRPGRRTLVSITGVIGLVLLALRSADLFCLTGLALFAVAFFLFPEKAEDRLACGLVGTAFFLILFAQRLYIYDRMNTFFKLYLECWILLAVATAVLAFRPSERRGSIRRWPAATKAALALLAGMALFTSVTVARGVLTDSRPTRKGEGGKPTLDGLRYLEKTDPGEYRAVLWMRRTIRGTPVVLEAQGASYQDFSRISMLTGLPTVLGWEYHVQQRGNPPEEIARRRSAVQAIYSNPGADSIEGLLRQYHVGYVYVGPLERRTYPRTGLAKFDTAKQLFALAYENPQVRIYRVSGGDTEDVIEPKREELPTPAAAAQSTEVVEPEESPILSDTPAPGRPPFSELKEPRDAAVDGQGRIWVADFGHSRLRLYDAEGGYLGGWGGRGNGNYQLREPCGVAVRGDDLLVADTWNGRILSFTVAGAWKAAASELYGPRGVAASPDGTVWATDTGNHRLVAYDAGLAAPRFVGRKGSEPGEFDSPVGIVAGPEGALYVCDAGNRRIQVLSPEGAFRRAIPIERWKSTDEPHVEVDDDGTIYATEPSGNGLLELAPDGRVLLRRDADDAGQAFSNPTGVALDRKNRILYVVNSGNSSIVKLKLSERKGR